MPKKPSNFQGRWGLHPLLIFLGGSLIGLAASIPLVVIWPYPVPPSLDVCVDGGQQIRLGGTLVFPFHCMAAYMFIQPLVWGSFLVAGGLFGFIAQRLANQGSPWLATLAASVTFFVAAFSGAQMVDRLPLPLNLPFLQPSIGQPFAIIVSIISFVFTLVMGFVLHTPHFLPRALIVAVVSGLTYMVISYSLYHSGPTSFAELLPTPGRPIGNMMKTVAVSNLIAGTVGGWTILLLLRRADGARLDPEDGKQM